MATKRKEKPARCEDDLPHPGDAARQDGRSSRAPMDTRAQIVPVVREEVAIDRKRIEVGRVRVTKKVTTREEKIAEPVFTEGVEVVRVPVNRPLDAPAMVRSEGDLTIVPIMEEVVVVEKRLILREELHIRRHRTESVHSEKVKLREESVDVQRLPPDRHVGE